MKIIIDAGHGKDTPGKRSPDGKLREWYFNSSVALKVQDKLKEYDVETVFIFDSKGSDVPLNTRVAKANDVNGKCVLVSIHANALGDKWSSANGIETFVYKKSLRGSLNVANVVQSELIKATGLTNRGVKEGNFAIIRDTNMDAILVECGFMDNKKECTLLLSDSYREKVAGAIVKGLVTYYKLKPKQTGYVVTAKGKDYGPFKDSKEVSAAVERYINNGTTELNIKKK